MLEVLNLHLERIGSVPRLPIVVEHRRISLAEYSLNLKTRIYRISVRELIWVLNLFICYSSSEIIIGKLAYLLGNGLIDKLIDEHKAIESTYFSEEQEKRLTPQEKNTEKEVKEAVEQAYKDHDIDKLGQLKTEWDKFSSPIKEVLQTYDGINQSPFEKGESELLSADSKNKINSAKENLDIAMKSRKVENMEKAKERWDTVVSESQGEIDREKDALVLKVANGSNLGGTLGSALSFGTVKSKTSVSGHSITMTAEYNSYFYSDDKIKQQAELYKSYGLGLVKTALKNLKYYVPDASITIQFKNSDGNVIVNMNVD